MERITEDVHRELTAIFRELKDPRVHQSMLSIVRVEVTNDLSHCTVYVSSMQGMEACKAACVGLKSAAGFMRSELGHRLKLRHVPQLHFVASDSIEYSANINKLLHDLKVRGDDDDGIAE
ncbi:MAG: 30S ribosome-binding factor RbfA [Oscillospiraceae bacterium]|nr:30S ribosome-binding factor RbfA [Oscillospiraceae bacterium]